MINTDFLTKCIDNLELSHNLSQKQDGENSLYNIYRSACIKEFELILEQSGKLLKKALQEYFTSNKELDKLTFKGIFRYAYKHSLLSEDEVLRWFKYRDIRNDTAHNYGESLAEISISVFPKFIIYSKSLVKNIKNN
jgi:nucleotidyltransferase substrate binding protein (TIGR01987 family)